MTQNKAVEKAIDWSHELFDFHLKECEDYNHRNNLISLNNLICLERKLDLIDKIENAIKEAEKQGKLNALGELSNGAEVIIIRSKQELEDIKNKAKQEGAEQIIEEFEKDFKGSLSDGIVAIESENWKEWKQKHLKKKGDEE